MTTELARPSKTPPPASTAGLSLSTSTSLVMGSIIGVGIFSLPYAIAARSSSLADAQPNCS